MNTSEFSNMFDTILDSYRNQAVFGESYSKADIVFDEYEKSVFLTQSQNILIEEIAAQQLIPGNNDIYRNVDISSLIVVANSTDGGNADTDLYAVPESKANYDDRGNMFHMPNNILLILNEKIMSGDKHFVVVPISYKEYDRCMSKAYNQPLKRQCWRLYRSAGNKYDFLSELVPIKGTAITNYRVMYIKRPAPIILVDLSKVQSNELLNIDGVRTVSECELNPDLHSKIVYKAVELALSSKGISTSKQQQNK